MLLLETRPVIDLYGAVQVRDDNMMPKQLLSTFHADNDYHIKDTYNYVTVRVLVMPYQSPSHISMVKCMFFISCTAFSLTNDLCVESDGCNEADAAY